MIRPRPVALIGAGPVARSSIARFLPGHVGPVKSASFRVAGRIVGRLRAGRAVKEYGDLEQSRLIVVCVPERALPGLIADLAASSLDLSRKSVALCDSFLDSGALAPLAERGAAVASLNEVPGFGGKRFVAEGHPRAIRDLRRLLAHAEARVLELKPGTKAVFLAGLSFAGELFAPLAFAAQSSFHLAGLQGGQASALIQQAFERSLRSYATAGRKGWTGPIASGNQAEVLRQIETLERASPSLARFLRQSAEVALELFGRDSAWLRAWPGADDPAGKLTPSAFPPAPGSSGSPPPSAPCRASARAASSA
jgi:predicted short-subunit dehydrogenase-like oxidoreductase (DUF2520 family)